MDEPKIDPPHRRAYVPPEIVFEEPMEALAAACDGTNNCPSKDSGQLCDSFQNCSSARS